MKCEVCSKDRTVKSFQQLTRNPATYSTTCTSCDTTSTDKLAADVAKRRNEKIATAAAERESHRKVVQGVRNQKVYDQKRMARLALKEKEVKKKAVTAATMADRELASRVLARRRLLHFIQKFKPDYEPGWVHEDICDRLERFLQDVVDKKSPRLILAMPPRHGKSEIASKNFPAYILGHHPTFEIIASSYNVSLPMGFSRKVRDMMQTPTYKAIFPKATLSKSSQAAEAWATTAGGGYVAAGVGGGITCKGAHVFIIDDPVKDAEEADSETMREKTWDWWGSTAKTRLAPGGGTLVIQTRWHDDDLSGRMILQMQEQTAELEELIAEARDRIAAASNDLERANIQGEIKSYQFEMDSIDKWEIVSYPAIATDDEYEDLETHQIIQGKDIIDLEDGYRLLREKDEPLHESRFPYSRLLNMRRSMQPRHWSALYQQNPVPDEGVYFTKGMFRMEPYTPVGHKYNVYIAWDLAIGEKQTNDYTVGAVIGVDYLDQIHVLDIIRGRWDALGIVETIIDTAMRYKPQLVGIEKGHLEMAIKPILARRMQERKAFFTLAEGKDALTPINDKSVRARPLQGRMQQGMVFFPSNQPWVEQAVFELMRFPGGVHDDIVDALSWVVRMAMRFPAPRAPKAQEHASWKDKLKAFTQGAGSKDPMSV